MDENFINDCKTYKQSKIKNNQRAQCRSLTQLNFKLHNT